MPAVRNPCWSPHETRLLREAYVTGGTAAAARALPHRSVYSVRMKAHRLGLKCTRPADAPRPKLQGSDLERAIVLREQRGWSFARIGAEFGVCEASAANAILIALCPRKGFTPAERDEYGRLTPHGLERVRYALKKGLKAVDIQLRLGVSATCVAEQRRRYNASLKANGKVTLPPPGGGEAYSGVKLDKAAIRRVESLFMQGLGSDKINRVTGVSKTSCCRIRARLVKRLRRKGETLPGCDRSGTRHVQRESSRFVPPQLIAALRELILDRIPVSRAARMLAIGSSTAYRVRDDLRAELAANGQTLPDPVRPGHVKAGTFTQRYWPPAGARAIYEFRALLAQMPFDEAKAAWKRRKAEEVRIDGERPRSFGETLYLVGEGKLGITAAIPRRHLEPRAVIEQARA